MPILLPHEVIHAVSEAGELQVGWQSAVWKLLIQRVTIPSINHYQPTINHINHINQHKPFIDHINNYQPYQPLSATSTIVNQVSIGSTTNHRVWVVGYSIEKLQRTSATNRLRPLKFQRSMAGHRSNWSIDKFWRHIRTLDEWRGHPCLASTGSFERIMANQAGFLFCPLWMFELFELRSNYWSICSCLNVLI